MNVAIYCGKWILPAKNGTRYLDRIFPTTGEEQGNSNNLFRNKKIKSVIYSNQLYMLADTDVTHLFIREPTTQLESALYTDLWGHLMPEERKMGLTKDNKKRINLLTYYTSTGTGHWCNTL